MTQGGEHTLSSLQQALNALRHIQDVLRDRLIILGVDGHQGDSSRENEHAALEEVLAHAVAMSLAASQQTTLLGPEPATEKDISNCPIVFVTSAHIARHDQQFCSICQEPFVWGMKVKQLPACGHLHCVGCIDEWLRRHRTCPICRRDVINVAVPEESAPDPSNRLTRALQRRVRASTTLSSMQNSSPEAPRPPATISQPPSLAADSRRQTQVYIPTGLRRSSMSTTMGGIRSSNNAVGSPSYALRRRRVV